MSKLKKEDLGEEVTLGRLDGAYCGLNIEDEHGRVLSFTRYHEKWTGRTGTDGILIAQIMDCIVAVDRPQAAILGARLILFAETGSLAGYKPPGVPDADR